MAHVGKFYRLHFRRDVLPTRDGHRWGIGAEYFFRLHLVPELGTTTLLQFGYTPALLYTGYDEWPIEFRGGPVTANGFNWTFRYRIDRWRFDQDVAQGDLRLYRNNVHSTTHILSIAQLAPGGVWADRLGERYPLWWNTAHWPTAPYMLGDTNGSPKAWNGGPVTP